MCKCLSFTDEEIDSIINDIIGKDNYIEYKKLTIEERIADCLEEKIRLELILRNISPSNKRYIAVEKEYKAIQKLEEIYNKELQYKKEGLL